MSQLVSCPSSTFAKKRCSGRNSETNLWMKWFTPFRAITIHQYAMVNLRSAYSLKKHCVRCDFLVTAIVDDPIHSILLEEANVNVTKYLFDRILKAGTYSSMVFAGHKPRDLLSIVDLKPFVVFLDADVIANHHTIPESLFDLLHKDRDLVLPMDWAHRHGELWGRGVPGLCTCLIAFLNEPSEQRVIRERESEIKLYNDPQRRKQRESFLHRSSLQDRDQELLSLVLHRNSFPEVNLFALGMEWMCPNMVYEKGQWVEGTKKDPASAFAHLTQNPCNALHGHSSSPSIGFSGFPYMGWLHSFRNLMGLSQANNMRCGGAKSKTSSV